MRYSTLLLIAIFIVLFLIDQRMMLRDSLKNSQTKPLERVHKKEVSKQDKSKIYLSDDNNKDQVAVLQTSVEEQLSILGVHIGDPIFIRIFKLTAELEIWIQKGESYQLLHSYTICRQSDYLGPKLKEGYDYFEEHRVPPNMEVIDKKYHFSAAKN